MKEVRIGLIGTGYIGKAHAIAYAQAPTVFELRGKLVREMVAEVSPALAAQRAQAFGFNRFTCDWRELVADPAIDVVDICSPNYLHKEMALAAIHHGKHVYAEKPLALNARDASEMAAAATRAGVKTLVGFNYIKNPSAKLAKEIIERGEIGEVIHFMAPITKTIWPIPIPLFTGTVYTRRQGWEHLAIWRPTSSAWRNIWWGK